jgi:hypothetical protein
MTRNVIRGWFSSSDMLTSVHYRGERDSLLCLLENNRSENYYNQNSRPQMQSFPRPHIRDNQNTYQPFDRCGFCGMDQHTRNICPARDKICHNTADFSARIA